MMLDTFEILTTSGVVLWSRSYAPISPAVINSLITNVFIEERTLPGAGIADDISAAQNPPYKYDQHTLKWTTVKELNIIFVVRVSSTYHLSLININYHRPCTDLSFTFLGSINWWIILRPFLLIFMAIN
jgi:signal recognition particle receptor subunit alpha